MNVLIHLQSLSLKRHLPAQLPPPAVHHLNLHADSAIKTTMGRNDATPIHNPFRQDADEIQHPTHHQEDKITCDITGTDRKHPLDQLWGTNGTCKNIAENRDTLSSTNAEDIRHDHPFKNGEDLLLVQPILVLNAVPRHIG